MQEDRNLLIEKTRKEDERSDLSGMLMVCYVILRNSTKTLQTEPFGNWFKMLVI